MNSFVVGWRRQWDLVLNTPGYWTSLLMNPLFATVFLAIMSNAGRDDLLAFAVLAPAFLTMWAMSLLISGEVVARDREFGVLEATFAAPTHYASVTIGRIGLVTVLSMLGFVESWLVAFVFFEPIPIAHPLAFAAGVAASAFAMTGTALGMSALFVRSTSVRRFQNAMSYPFYVLGGVLVPVEFLPDWIQPLSRVIFLSWSSDLLRDSLAPAPVERLGIRLLMIVLLGGAAMAAGWWAVDRMEDHVRETGEVAFT